MNHLQKYRKVLPQLVEHIEGSLYVDDLSLGAASEKELWDMKTNAQQIFLKGVFKLRKWVSNSAHLNKKIKSGGEKISEIDDSSIAEQLLGQGDAQGAKILGVGYEKDTDRLYISVRDIAKNGLDLKKTKRNLLSMSASIYDPFGIISPVVLPLKLLFQKKERKGRKGRKLHFSERADQCSLGLILNWNVPIQVFASSQLTTRFPSHGTGRPGLGLAS